MHKYEEVLFSLSYTYVQNHLFVGNTILVQMF